jgi:tetratricopeptide (TPR) repeat protein
MGMLRGLVCCLCTAVIASGAVRDVAAATPPGTNGCFDFRHRVVDLVEAGEIQEAETTLREVVSDRTRNFSPFCLGIILGDLATVLYISGKLHESESFAERAVNELEQIAGLDAHVLMRPLQVLSAVRLEEGKIHRAEEAFQKMQRIRVEEVQDDALIHGMRAALCYVEHRYGISEQEYLAALRAWEKSGRGNSADAAAVLNALGLVYIKEKRFEDASRVLKRSLSIATGTRDAVAVDLIKIYRSLAVLHAQLSEWHCAEEDMKEALSIADSKAQLDPTLISDLLTKYAYVLQKGHRSREARLIKARLAAIRRQLTDESVVDVTELSGGGRSY